MNVRVVGNLVRPLEASIIIIIIIVAKARAVGYPKRKITLFGWSCYACQVASSLQRVVLSPDAAGGVFGNDKWERPITLSKVIFGRERAD